MVQITCSGLLASLSIVIHLGIGIACCVVYAYNQDIPCGIHGQPPLPEFVLGTGISYIIIGGALVFGIFVLPLLVVVALFGGLFQFAWMIVGSVSLFRDGADCEHLNYPIWAVGMAAVISTYVLFGLSAWTSKSSNDDRQKK